MLKIKLNNQFPKWDWLRQTSNHSGIWKDMQFYVNDDSVSECDFFITMGGLLKNEKVTCPRENTIFLALENKETQNYDQKFLNQFYYVLTHRNDIKHPRLIKSVFPAYWFIGIDTSSLQVVSDKSYDFLKSNDFSTSKTKLISVISSNKDFTEGHKKRLAFIEILKREFGDGLDFFGRGINDFKDKWEVLYPYKYHIVLENSSFDDELTEKIYDSFLAQCFSFYYGSKSATKYFDRNSFCEIDINDPLNAIQKIKEQIAGDAYLKNIAQIANSKEAVLERYNLFNILYTQILNHRSASKKVEQSFYSENFILEKNRKKNAGLYTRIKRRAYKSSWEFLNLLGFGKLFKKV